ncbi:Hypothetical predicted protein, partial [Paramuricea clavata]
MSHFSCTSGSQPLPLSTFSPKDFLLSQESDVNLQKWITHHVADSKSPYLPKKIQSNEDKSTELWFDVSGQVPRLLVPSDRQKEIFKTFHSISHGSFKPTYVSISRENFWPRMKADIRRWSRDCSSCQRNKTARATRAPLQQLNVPSDR